MQVVEVSWARDGTSHCSEHAGDKVTMQMFRTAAPGPNGGRMAIVRSFDAEGNETEAVLYSEAYRLVRKFNIA